MIIKKILIYFIEKITLGFSIFVIYCSVLVGILFPMLIIGGFFIFLRNFYWISWYLADPTILGKDLVTCWLNSYWQTPFFSSDTWLYLKTMIFIVGLILFIISLTTLILGIKKDAGLIQSGIYKHIRHPQNLSIIIMAFPLFLYLGFRMGDFISWVQFIFIMIIYSDIGDKKLKKKIFYKFSNVL